MPLDPLWQQLDAFALDDTLNPVKSFAGRLAHENGWTLAYADRVIHEYKRFIYLAATAGRQVTPSKAVDICWHQHLIFTRSYWDRLCNQVLGCALHHEPTQGSSEDAKKFRDQYQATQILYRDAFCSNPPVDIWPDYKPPVPKKGRQMLARIGLAVAVLCCGAGCIGGFDPYTMKGPEFLGLFVPLVIAMAILGKLAGMWLWYGSSTADTDGAEMTWEEAAYAEGGANRLLLAAVSRLVARGEARVSPDRRYLEIVGADDANDSLSEGIVRDSLPMRNSQAAFKTITRVVEECFAERKQRMYEAGLLLTAAQKNKIMAMTLLPLWGTLLILGVPRLITGLSSGKPTGFLIIIFVISMFISLILAMTIKSTTPKGRSAVKGLREDYKTRLGTQTPEVVGYAVAVLGLAALTAPELLGLKQWYPTFYAGGDSGGCSDSGGGDSGGGGCGGGCGGGGD